MRDVAHYIAQFEPDIQERLLTLQKLFLAVHPHTFESIRYNIPSYKVGKKYLYFAAYKNHIGFYPVYGLEEIEQEIKLYRAKGTKHSLHFPHNKPLPKSLIRKIIAIKLKAQN